ncbi:protein phosphatase CheZ [Polymorphum gilvum]|uniref:Uncharacterized protein n=1 Tax=Polymorphum gilvum (strain LMG 25793 / CGMCC 1.9160 / SL003B-26A1) TaxID=991905 RepID=F2J3B0_POLGS|nr:protein phosphatase CheZ [Polymorphum gilvum]ADZ69917.1 hypothetical protein SL003B_1489 [Polymorphum gilvum SL003B-26A1]
MASSEPPVLIQENEYNTLEQTLSESDRGRRFLAEYLRRHRSSETTSILDAIGRLERLMRRERTVPDLDRIRLDIADMHEAIERTKREIANIKQEEADGNRFTDASLELDAIVTQTEGATQDILNAAEKIQEQAWILREAGADETVCDEIDAKATEIFMACSFQDLTGQRTQKVVQVLRYLESRINLMIGIWGIEEVTAEETAGPVDTRPDAHLLNGPQRAGMGVSQTDIDDMLGAEATAADPTADIDFDSIDIGDDEPHSVDADADASLGLDPGDDTFGFDPGEELDAATIDSIFDETPSSEDTDVDDLDLSGEMDEDKIAKLFDLVGKAAESSADAAWEEEEERATVDLVDDDPLAQLTEAERQSLFS